MQFIGTGDRILTENFNVGYLYTITFKSGNYINTACIGIGDNFVMFQRTEPDLLFTLNVDTAEDVDTIVLYDSGGGTNDYDDLVNRPQINSHTLTGNMSGADLGLQNTISDLDTIRSGAAAGATAVQPATMEVAVAQKQDALSSEQLEAVNSGITAADVAQIDTNKNNILSNTLNGGGINKFQVTATSTTINGITFTVNPDKTITATGSIADSTQGSAIFTMGAYTAVSGDVLSEGFAEANSKAYIYARGGSTSLANAPYRAIAAGDIGIQRNYACVITADTVGQVNITFKPMICNSDSYAKSGVYQPYAMSNAELTAGKADLAKTVMRGDTYVANTTKTYALTAAKTYLISVVCYNVAGLFLAFKYSTESTPRLFPVYKTADFDNYMTVSAVADSSNIQISSASSSTWYYSNIAML